MKKLIGFLTFVSLAVSVAFADIYNSSRYVELGFDFDAGLNQNVFTMADIFMTGNSDNPGLVVIDFTKIADDMTKMNQKGLVIDGELGMDGFLKLNFKRFQVGLVTNFSSSGNFFVGKDLFTILGKGNEIGKEYEISEGGYFESFVSTSLPIGIRIGRFKITATPTAFIPIVYIPETTSSVKFTAKNNGAISAEANANFTAYGIFDLTGLNGVMNEISSLTSTTEISTGSTLSYTELMSNLQMENMLSDVLNSMGFDVNLAAEMALFSSLDVGAYANVPIVPAKLHNSVSGNASWTFSMDGVLNSLGGETTSPTFEQPTFSGLVFSNSENYTVNRPFRFGAEAAFRPFGKWLTVRGKGGVAMRNPFGADFNITNSINTSSMYPEYKVGADLRLLYVFNFSLSHEYTDKVFVNRLGLGLNFRVLELDFALATSSTNFVRSFQVSGLQAALGMRIGF